MLPGDLAVREVHGESSEGLTALAEAAGRVLLRQEDLVPEPVRHLDTRREVTETRGNGNDQVVYLYLSNVNGDLKLVFSLVSAGAGLDILG